MCARLARLASRIKCGMPSSNKIRFERRPRDAGALAAAVAIAGYGETKTTVSVAKITSNIEREAMVGRRIASPMPPESARARRGSRRLLGRCARGSVRDAW